MEMNSLFNRYYAMRHGESWANAQDIIVSQPEAGEDPAFGLTKKGRQQVEASALQSGLGRKTLIYASPFSRTTETAELVADVLGTRAVVTDMRLRERYFGDFEGASTENYTHVWFRDERNSRRYMNVEGIAHVALRAVNLMMELELKQRGNDILFVSHGDTLQALEASVRGMSPRQHRELDPLQPAEIRCLNPEKTV